MMGYSEEIDDNGSCSVKNGSIIPQKFNNEPVKMTKKSTGFVDKNNKPIMIGDLVRDPQGAFEGEVVFANGSYRYKSFKDPDSVNYNFSLLFCDRHKPEEFEVIG